MEKQYHNFFLLFVIMQNVEKQKIYVFLENEIGIGSTLFNKNFQTFFTLTVSEKILKNRNRFLQKNVFFFIFYSTMLDQMILNFRNTTYLMIPEKMWQKYLSHKSLYRVFHIFIVFLVAFLRIWLLMHYVLHRLNFQRSNRFQKFPKVKKNANSL